MFLGFGRCIGRGQWIYVFLEQKKRKKKETIPGWAMLRIERHLKSNPCLDP